MTTRSLVFYLKINSFVSVSYVQDEAYGEHVGHQRRASVAEKRERDAGYGENSYAHAYIFKGLEGQHGRDSGADIKSLAVAGVEADIEAPQNYRGQQHNNGYRADHAELLAHDRVNKIGVPLGEQIAVAAGAVVEAHAGQLAAAHRYARADDVIAAAGGVKVGVEQSDNSVLLVGLKQKEPRDRAHGREGQNGAQNIFPVELCHEQHGRRHHHKHHDLSEVGLKQHEKA